MPCASLNERKMSWIRFSCWRLRNNDSKSLSRYLFFAKTTGSIDSRNLLALIFVSLFCCSRKTKSPTEPEKKAMWYSWSGQSDVGLKSTRFFYCWTTKAELYLTILNTDFTNIFLHKKPKWAIIYKLRCRKKEKWWKEIAGERLRRRQVQLLMSFSRLFSQPTMTDISWGFSLIYCRQQWASGWIRILVGHTWMWPSLLDF